MCGCRMIIEYEFKTCQIVEFIEHVRWDGVQLVGIKPNGRKNKKIKLK